MESFTAEHYSDLCSQSQVVQEDAYGVKVLRLEDGQMVKIFRRKRLLSSALLRPYARRFQQNAERLTALAIRTVHVNRVCSCLSPARHLVFYKPVPGIPLRDFLAEKPGNNGILEKFSAFLAELHAKGVYFHSLHFGNVIVLPDGSGFALIDIADLSFRSGSLHTALRIRN